MADQSNDSFNEYFITGSDKDFNELTEWNFNRKFNNGSPNHYGKGPKNYCPSDESVKEKVCEALFRDHMIDASEIQVTVDNGVVRLHGKVSDRKTKKYAEHAIEHIYGVVDILNYLTLKPDYGLVGRTDGWPQ